jgi:Tol biopolymer transport system component
MQALGGAARAAVLVSVLLGVNVLPAPATAASPGANGAIAFSVGNDFPAQMKNLVEVNPDGSGRAQVTGLDGDVNDLAPVFSPDGNRVAFGRCPLGCGGGIPVYIASADGTGARFLTSSIDGTATWSPDGSKLAVLDETPTLGIYVINADGTDRHLLIDGSVGGTGPPTWSPDGQRIAVYDDAFPGDPHQLGLYLIDVAGAVSNHGRKHLLLADEDPNAGAGGCDDIEGYAYDWSPDGTKLVYRCLEPDGAGGANGDIAIVDASTGVAKRIVSTPGSIFTSAGVEWFPRFSPDGTKIVYERESAIWTATATGADQHPIGAGYRPSWQPCTSATTRCGPPPAAGSPPTGSPPGGDGGPPVPGSTDACPLADGPAANDGCPVNTFKFGKARPTRTGTRIAVKVPGPGTVSIAKTRRTRAVKKHASAAGAVKLTLKLTAAGRRSFGRKRQTSVPVKVTFRPDGGKARSQTARIKFIR